MPESPDKKDRILLLAVYNLLYKVYGDLGWWPAETPFEVMVGAVLTQNTSWANVEKAISSLKKRGVLSPRALRSINIKTLARLIRPCGYYNVKAKRLKNLIGYIFLSHRGSIASMRRIPLEKLRKELLAVNGIGPETADSILLYALGKPVFVVDAYTRRLGSCIGLIKSDDHYTDIQSLFMRNLPRKNRLFNEFHALIVEHAKTVCRSRPRCSLCVLHRLKRGNLCR